MPCGDCSTDDQCRCGPGEMCGSCFESRVQPEDVPKILEAIAKPKPCTCGPDEACGDPCVREPECQHPNKYNYGFASGPPGIRYFYCSGCKAKWEEEQPEEPHRKVCPRRHPESGIQCLKDGALFHMEHVNGDAVWDDRDQEPPLTPEEEEQAPEDADACDHLCRCEHEQQDHNSSGYCNQCDCAGSSGHYPSECPEVPEDEPRCTCGETACESELCDCDTAPWSVDHVREAQKLPPQPDRRPPYAVSYSVQGHLYEVALSGDASVRAVDGALVIQHHLGPVAGIVQVLPVINEESA